MTAVDELREALRSAADTADPPQDLLAGARRRMRRARRIRAGVAAGVTAAVCAASVSLMPSLEPERKAALVPLPPAPSRFFVTLTSKSLEAAKDLTVRDVGTGKVVAKVPNPADLQVWSNVNATWDSRVYYLSGWSKGGDVARLYRLELDTAGKVRGLTRVRDLADANPEDLAVSPDGRTVAFPATEPDGRAADVRIQLSSLSGGATRTVAVRATRGAHSLSWSANGQRLVFVAGPLHYADRPDDVYVVDVRGDGQPERARRVIETRGALGELARPVLSADGTRVYVSAAQGSPSWTRLLELDAATGKQRRVLFQQQYKGGTQMVWMFSRVSPSLSGTALILWSGSSGHRVDLATGKVHRFPFPGRQPQILTW
ncbi:TolB-like translocation protein [Actinomadura rudentiformis]|uniref:Uncharacterized protein n=1 Tax=Actinomadura rudentiformis TaxID=359158 RepID=A0A6H9Y8L7_9ACTN|nr:hypothetical protein [Actinomadura rudentiformis]KAB2340534.1 hypothetical protein F8566_44130 [Actinomadura rudentiformis]